MSSVWCSRMKNIHFNRSFIALYFETLFFLSCFQRKSLPVGRWKRVQTYKPAGRHQVLGSTFYLSAQAVMSAQNAISKSVKSVSLYWCAILMFAVLSWQLCCEYELVQWSISSVHEIIHRDTLFHFQQLLLCSLVTPSGGRSVPSNAWLLRWETEP